MTTRYLIAPRFLEKITQIARITAIPTIPRTICMVVLSADGSFRLKIFGRPYRGPLTLVDTFV